MLTFLEGRSIAGTNCPPKTMTIATAQLFQGATPKAKA